MKRERRTKESYEEAKPEPKLEPKPEPEFGQGTTISKDLLGRKVSILRPVDGMWYEGRVFKYNERERIHYIVYYETLEVELINIHDDTKIPKRPYKLIVEKEEDKLFRKLIHCALDGKATKMEYAPTTDLRAMVLETRFERPDEDEDENPPAEKLKRGWKTRTVKQEETISTSGGDRKVKMYQLIYLENEFLPLVNLKKVDYRKVEMNSMRSKEHIYE